MNKLIEESLEKELGRNYLNRNFIGLDETRRCM